MKAGYGPLYGPRKPARDVIELIAEVLRGIPRLDGAACITSPRVFDGACRDDVRAALTLCVDCPCLFSCHCWAKRQPTGSLTGVVGGMVFVEVIT